MGHWQGLLTKTHNAYTYTFNIRRIPELIVAICSTWWLTAILVGQPVLHLEIHDTIRHNQTVIVAFGVMNLLMWLNFYRKIDDMRAFVMLLTVGWWSALSTFVFLYFPSAPSVVPYLGMTWLSIYNGVRNQVPDGNH